MKNKKINPSFKGRLCQADLISKWDNFLSKICVSSWRFAFNSAKNFITHSVNILKKDLVGPKSESGKALSLWTAEGEVRIFQQWQWCHEEQWCTPAVSNFRFLTVRELKVRNLSVLEANNMVMKMELDKYLEPYGMVSCSCRQLSPGEPFPLSSFCTLAITVWTVAVLWVFTFVLISEDANYASDYFRKCLWLLHKPYTIPFPMSN